MRGEQLSSFAWALCRRAMLYDHIALTIREIRAIQLGEQLPDGIDRAGTYVRSWDSMRRGTPKVLRELSGVAIEQGKLLYREHLKALRHMLKPHFDEFTAIGVSQSWPDLLDEIEREGLVGKFLRDLIRLEDSDRLVSDYSAVAGMPYRILPGTAAWVQFYIAQSFVAVHESGKYSRPDAGDQVDFRHAAYAGIADLFVTDDVKMYKILNDKVITRRAEVVMVREFLDRVRRGELSATPSG
jgi:hypothetical protein